MTPAEAHAAAAAEGLVLVRADNTTGFKGVSHSNIISKPFKAELWRRRPAASGPPRAAPAPPRRRASEASRPGLFCILAHDP